MKDIYMKKNIIKYTLMKAFCIKLGYFKIGLKKLNRGNLFRIPRFLYSDLFLSFQISIRKLCC